MDLRDQLATCQGPGLRSLYGFGIQKAGPAIYVSVCKGSLSEGVLGPPPSRMPFLGTRTPASFGLLRAGMEVRLREGACQRGQHITRSFGFGVDGEAQATNA